MYDIFRHPKLITQPGRPAFWLADAGHSHPRDCLRESTENMVTLVDLYRGNNNLTVKHISANYSDSSTQ